MRIIITTLILTAVFALTGLGQKAETLTLRAGQQKSTADGGVKVKFLRVMEDSRCPANAKCVWAGNARIRISAKIVGHSARSFELNSTLKPQVVTHFAYEFAFAKLRPIPGLDASPRRKNPIATISVTRR